MKTKLMLKLEEIVNKPIELWLEQKYQKEYFSFAAIAQEINKKYNIKIVTKTISNWFDKLKIKKLSRTEIMLKGKRKPSRDELNQLYNEEHKSIRQIACQYNVNYRTIYDLFDSYGMQRKNIHEGRYRGRKKPSDEKLYVLHVIEGKSFYQIAKIFDFSPSTIYKMFKKIKIESNIEYYKQWLKKFGENGVLRKYH